MGQQCGSGCRGLDRKESTYTRTENSIKRIGSERSIQSKKSVASPNFKAYFSLESPLCKQQSDESMDIGDESHNNSFHLKVLPLNDREGSSPSRRQMSPSNFKKMLRQQQANLIIQKYQMEQEMRIQLHKQMQETRSKMKRRSPNRETSSNFVDRASKSIQQSPEISRRPVRHQSQVKERSYRSQGRNYSYAGSQESVRSFTSKSLKNRLVGVEIQQSELYSYRTRNSNKKHSSILKKKSYNQSSTENFSLRKTKKVRFTLGPAQTQPFK